MVIEDLKLLLTCGRVEESSARRLPDGKEAQGIKKNETRERASQRLLVADARHTIPGTTRGTPTRKKRKATIEDANHSVTFSVHCYSWQVLLQNVVARCQTVCRRAHAGRRTHL